MDFEYTNREVDHDFSFLNFSDVKAHFADLNIELLRGRHIQTGEGYIFTLVNNYSSEFQFYYRTLYGLELKREKSENIEYYYLDFPEEGKGRLYSNDRHREMSTWESLIAFMLLNMYYDRLFDRTKTINRSILEQEIMNSDLSPSYKKIFFNNAVRDFYSDPEWKTAMDNYKRVLRTLDQLGWVKLLPAGEGDGDILFIIKESINRFAALYQYEISHFDTFVEQILQKKNKK
ncbi:condensin complex protein MksE [Sphingobacterium sp. LRF_L2]|uniref:condensin complex protein MksE n=1 Tax=Sphingobacterium sp. LRF_L2 TaxID=3369421 RepID=UPI003F63BD7A